MNAFSNYYIWEVTKSRYEKIYFIFFTYFLITTSCRLIPQEKNKTKITPKSKHTLAL